MHRNLSLLVAFVALFSGACASAVTSEEVRRINGSYVSSIQNGDDVTKAVRPDPPPSVASLEEPTSEDPKVSPASAAVPNLTIADPPPADVPEPKVEAAVPLWPFTFPPPTGGTNTAAVEASDVPEPAAIIPTPPTERQAQANNLLAQIAAKEAAEQNVRNEEPPRSSTRQVRETVRLRAELVVTEAKRQAEEEAKNTALAEIARISQEKERILRKIGVLRQAKLISNEESREWRLISRTFQDGEKAILRSMLWRVFFASILAVGLGFYLGWRNGMKAGVRKGWATRPPPVPPPAAQL